MQDRRPFAIAGLWDHWEGPDGSDIKTCTIITTTPNEIMAPIHDRMPVIVHPRDYKKWLDPSPQTPESLQPLIKPFPAENMSVYAVSPLVNKTTEDTPEMVVPA
jgi:putative SOS response-associated peptidase YedK